MSQHHLHKTKNKDRITFSQMAAYGFGGIIPIALFNIAGQLMGLIGNIGLGISALWLGVIMIIPRLWDAVSDPIVGHISDNARFKWGRRRPFILFGGIGVAVSFVIMWWLPDGQLVHSWFPGESAFQWFQLGYILFWLLIFFTACTIFEIPHGALGMEMTSDYHERTRLFSAKSFVGNLFSMSTPWLFALANMEVFKGTGNEADGMRYVSILVAVILIPLSIWWFLKLKEPGFKLATKQKKEPFWKNMKRTIGNKTFINLVIIIFTVAMGFNFVNLLAYYIQIFYLFGGDKDASATILGVSGTVWAITGLLAVFPLNWISPKLGKRKTLILAIILMCLAQLSKIICYSPQFPYLILIPFILLSAGMLFFFTLGASMVGDVCDEDDLMTGHRSEGSYYSIYWWFIKMGTALASFVAGLLIVFTQFDESQVTKVDALHGSIKEIQNKIKFWKETHGNNTAEIDISKSAVSFAEVSLKESKDFIDNLENELLKNKKLDNKTLETKQTLELDELSDLLAKIKTNSGKLEQLKRKLDGVGSSTEVSEFLSINREIIPLALDAAIKKANYRSSDLLFHLNEKLMNPGENIEHNQTLLKKANEMGNRLESLNIQMSLDDFDKELTAVEEEMLFLKKQAPYTLLMMRVVEIGLPLLLSLFSIILALRYRLTEARCLEVKDALEKRNAKRSRESLAD